MAGYEERIRIGSIWKHTNGTEYKVMSLSNLQTTDVKRFIPTVIYEGLYSHTVWSRPIVEFLKKFKEV